MRRAGGTNGQPLKIFSDPGQPERLLVEQGQRVDSAQGLVMPYVIRYAYGPENSVTEFETIETYRTGGDTPKLVSIKDIVREKTGQPVRLPLTLMSHGLGEMMVIGQLNALGHTVIGGGQPDPREPWAHFEINDPVELERVFGNVNAEGRRPNATGTYLELKAAENDSLLARFSLTVNRREVTFTRGGRITLDFGPDTAEGKRGPLLKATLAKNLWVEGVPGPRGIRS